MFNACLVTEIHTVFQDLIPEYELYKTTGDIFKQEEPPNLLLLNRKVNARFKETLTVPSML